ncbi:hypothetical protein WN59_12990 [Salinicoccus sediminis]|uniref:ABC-2 transporter permease n=1 Tax=Salinicoccus sediminis TaxID=1432562 RepID=A0A0M2SF99_9STAP|nr:hypothetical protein [Salinicoccus sediminis]KKK32953.1 hypothetical protein WN59_12990 [Salinicoccus sediminis]
MKKQLYLNLMYSKWIWMMGGIMIVINLLAAFSQSLINLQPFMPFVNLLNLIVMVYTISSIQNIHTLITKNDSHHFLYSLPIRKTDILKADYIYHALMLVFTVAVFSTYVIIGHDYHLYYGLVMIMGASLIMMSIYLIIFANSWLDSAILRYIIYFLPLFIIYMFHFMPLNNTVIHNIDLGIGWDIYRFVLPFIVLGAGIIVYAASYLYGRKKIVKSDIV